MEIGFYKVEDGLVRISLEEHEDKELVSILDMTTKTQYYNLSLRVENYCIQENLKFPWVKTKFVINEEDISLVKKAILANLRQTVRPLNTIVVKTVTGKRTLTLTEIIPKKYDTILYFEDAVEGTFIRNTLYKYKYEKTSKYEITDEEIWKELKPTRLATPKDFPYVTEKPDFLDKELKHSSKGIKAFYIYKSGAAARVTSTMNLKSDLLGGFYLPNNKKAINITEEIINLRDIQPLLEKAQKIMKEYYNEKYYEII